MSAADTTSFGDRLRLLREAAGLTQEELAAKAGVTAKGIAAIERGRRQRPYPNTIRALADALGLDERGRASLIGGQAAPPPAPEHPAAPALRSAPLAPPTALIGREEDREAARAILLDVDTRLLTLTGAGGVGKTSLSLALAADCVERFRDGAVFVALAALVDPDLVLPTIARALGLDLQPGRPVRDLLHAALRDRELLLVLDNWEQVLDAAPEVAALLIACPAVRVLATSRAALRLRGEREYPVAPLSVPQLTGFPVAAQLAENPAVMLFVARAASVAPNFALTQTNAAAIAAICRRLDGLPLAIELAAARIRLLSPTELLARLDRALPLLSGGPRDLPDRQRTMERAIGWSYDLITPPEARLYRQLAPFTGGWSLAAAESVAATDDGMEDDPLELLAALVEHALVVALPDVDTEGRYRMLEPIRQFAMQRLQESGEEADARGRHAAYFFALVREADAGLGGPEQVAWLDRLELEHDNLRAALTWAAQSAKTATALAAVGVLSRFWWTRGYAEEGRRWLDLILALPGEESSRERAEALNGAGNLAFTQGDYAAARHFHERSLALRRALDDRRGIAGSLNNLGLLATHANDLAQARALYEEAIELNRAMGNRAWEAINLGNLASTLVSGGDAAGARGLLERGLTLFSDLGNAWGTAMTTFGLGDVARALGEPDRARAYFAESLERRRAVGDRRGLAQSLVGLADIETSAGEFAEARAHLDEALTIARAIADRQRLIACLEGYALLAAAQDDDEQAALLNRAATAERAAIGAPRPPNLVAQFARASGAAASPATADPLPVDLDVLLDALLRGE